jgi:hypothetical protein
MGVRLHGSVFAFFVVVDPAVGGAQSGWLMASLGIAPTFLGLGVTTGVHAFTSIRRVGRVDATGINHHPHCQRAARR